VCGIVGGAGRKIPEDVLNIAVTALSHRGPDGSAKRTWTAEGSAFSFGHTRLAINDLSPDGAQPMTLEGAELWMVFNGEIYNYPELRRQCELRGRRFRSRMDGEVILHLWALEGPSALAKLNGIFAVAVADARSGTLWLARDPIGVKPLFYSVLDDGSVRFASELSALRVLDVDDGGQDVIALAQFLSFLWVPAPATPYRRMRSMEPGVLATWSRGKLSLSRYAPPLVPRPQSDIRVDELMQNGLAAIDAAATRQLLSDVPVGIMASGGVDSGLIWSGAKDGLSKAYTITWDRDSGEGLREDTQAVELTARQLGTQVRFIKGETWDRERLPAGGDLLADPSYELTRIVARAAREDGAKVLLSGQGGDELLGGYRRHHAAWLLERLRLPGMTRLAHAMSALPGPGVWREYALRMSAAMAERDPFRRYMRLCTYSSASERARALGTTESEVSDDMVWARHADVFFELPDQLSLLRKAMTMDLRIYLPGLGLAYADRAAMEESVEVRVPLLDLEFVRWSLTLPDDVLIRRGQSKWLGKQLALKRLPRSTVLRPKRGFGAPSRELTDVPSPPRTRELRQRAYFNRATRLLGSFMSEVP
jgi:asparagine synthase (glutamine-hydrolysing)